METASTSRIQKIFREVRRELLSAAAESPASSGRVINATRLLDDLEQVCLEQMTPSPRRVRPKEYYRTISVRGVCLAEDWDGAKQPFLVPRPLYDHCAEAVAHFSSPVTFATILNHLRSEVPDAPDYALRTCLRFWRDLETRILEVTGSRYMALNPERFARQAARAWDSLPERQD